MTLTPKNREDIVKYRLEKASESLRQVRDILQLRYWNLIANRLYYAAYYSCSALLIRNNIEASTHKGVINRVGQSFVLSGTLPRSDSKLLNKLYSMRQTGDYEDLFDWEEADVLPLIPQVEDFIQRMTALINNAWKISD